MDYLLEDAKSHIETLGSENIACFIAEPIQGAGGLIVPPEGYHVKMGELCKEYDIKYITDEVVTAFGRLGHFLPLKMSSGCNLIL